MQNRHSTPALSELDKYELVNKTQDIRGRPLISRDGRKIGVVQRLLVDEKAQRVAALALDDGRTIPIEDVEVSHDAAILTPAASDAFERSAKPTARPAATAEQTNAASAERIPIVNEELVVGKHAVPLGEVHVRTRIIERPVEKDVTLRSEHIEIERQKVGQPLSRNEAEALLHEREIRAREVVEEPVVQKRAEVTEEVVMRREQDQRIETVRDTVRETEVETEATPQSENLNKDTR